jgi:hypothetical protein
MTAEAVTRDVEAQKIRLASMPWWARVLHDISWRWHYFRAVFTGGPTPGELMLMGMLKRNREQRRQAMHVAKKVGAIKRSKRGR